ncbi:MAG TPA: ABC transporter ATP-binding protein, partial [Flavobacteriaceae bacterium]|nr:ABC transporter ATP-binding protein [Flavobacteriaceae bacterium]
MPLKAVLFDMDGVIVDTEPLHRKAYFQTFKDLNITVSEEFYTSLTGTSTKKSTQMIKDEFNLDVLPEEITASKRKYFKHYFDTDPDFD